MRDLAALPRRKFFFIGAITETVSGRCAEIRILDTVVWMEKTLRG
jgi:hypothetical protein